MALPTLKQQLHQLISLPSVSCTDPKLDMGNRAVVELLAQWLEELGFRCEFQAVAPGKANLIATLGTGPGGLVLSGHTDTVPWDETRWQHDPFALTEDNQRFYGLGSCDMKGFFPLVLEAIRDIDPKLLKAPLIVLATCDEETHMAGARALVQADKVHARYAVIGEPTSLKPINVHKGIAMERVTVVGKSGHSSDPARGINAIEVMHQLTAELLNIRRDIQAQNRHEGFAVPYPTLNLGCIHGGDNPNRICGECRLEYDLRTVPGQDIEELRARISHKLQNIAQQQRAQIHFDSLFPGLDAFAQDRHSDLIQTVERLTHSEAQSVAFATEAPLLQQLGMQTVVLGAGSIEQAHQPDEYLALDQITPYVDIVAKLVNHYCVGERRPS